MLLFLDSSRCRVVTMSVSWSRYRLDLPVLRDRLALMLLVLRSLLIVVGDWFPDGWISCASTKFGFQ